MSQESLEAEFWRGYRACQAKEPMPNAVERSQYAAYRKMPDLLSEPRSYSASNVSAINLA